MSKLACRNLWKVYGPRTERYFDTAVLDRAALIARLRSERQVPAVADISLEIHEGEIFVIMGLSGSGKSTVLRCLSRLIEPSSGEVLLDGINLLEVSDKELIEIRRHRIGMVFQHVGLLPHLSVLENVAFPLRAQRIPLAARTSRAREMIHRVGLDGKENASPQQLSGGEQQRVGIARSLAVRPELWLLDEPFSALDPLMRRQLQDEFLSLQRDLKKTVVFVTHDVLEAVRLADRVAILRDGCLVQIGTPRDIVLNPADDYVARFVADVPRARVLLVRDIVEPVAAPPASLAVSARMTLEQLIEVMSAGHSAVGVTDERGLTVGSVSVDRLVRALVRPLSALSNRER
jgi:glycine betaine/proline transport system ATP-binding protein